MTEEVYENWFAVIDKKGELVSVEENKDMAEGVSALFELDLQHPTNKVVQVTIITVPLLDLVVKILDEAQERLNARRLAEIEENRRAFNPQTTEVK